VIRFGSSKGQLPPIQSHILDCCSIH